MLLGGAVNTVNATLYENLKFDFMRDIAPIAGIIRVPNLMEVNSSFPAKKVPEVISYAKANPGKVTFASTGIGTTQHLSGELFKMMTDINMVHVAYRGAPPALTDLISGQVQVMFGPLPASIALIRAGKLRPLAVPTTTRSEALPNIPPGGSFVPAYHASHSNPLAPPHHPPPHLLHTPNQTTQS